MDGEAVDRGGGPVSGGRGRRARWWAGGVLAVIAAAGLVVFGLSAAQAKAPSPSPSPSSSAAPGYGWWGPWGGPWGGRGGFVGGPFDVRDALHGEVVVAKVDGGTETLLIQRGDVVAVSASSVEVKSADGFTRKYVVNGDTKVGGARSSIDSVATGDTVVVCAVSGSGGPTARSLAVLAHK
jgi:hypothetical protein